MLNHLIENEFSHFHLIFPTESPVVAVILMLLLFKMIASLRIFMRGVLIEDYYYSKGVNETMNTQHNIWRGEKGYYRLRTWYL